MFDADFQLEFERCALLATGMDLGRWLALGCELQTHIAPLEVITTNDLARGLVAFTLVDLGLLALTDTAALDDMVAWVAVALLQDTVEEQATQVWAALQLHLTAAGVQPPPLLAYVLRLRVEAVVCLLLSGELLQWEPFVLAADEQYGCRHWAGWPEAEAPARPTAAPELRAHCWQAA